MGIMVNLPTQVSEECQGSPFPHLNLSFACSLLSFVLLLFFECHHQRCLCQNHLPVIFKVLDQAFLSTITCLPVFHFSGGSSVSSSLLKISQMWIILVCGIGGSSSISFVKMVVSTSMMARFTVRLVPK